MARKEQDYKITQSEEYKEYLKALCRLSSDWIPEIRVQFAAKAYDKYQDATIRKLVLAYGEEKKKLDEYMYNHFRWESESDEPNAKFLEGDILNKAGAFAKTIYFLFDIKHTA